MKAPTCERTECPSGDDLTWLIQGEIPESRQEELSEHVGSCTNCQDRMESLATAGDSNLSDIVRHIDKDTPPSNSAYWKALDKAESEVMQDFASVAEMPSDLKLDFLQPSDTPGRIGRVSTFDIVRVIGRGGMGVVLHAFDPSLSRDVAIKMLDPQLASNDVARQRFCREARSAAAVSHDNIVAVHQVNEDEKSGLPFIVMQLVSGESLEQRLRRVSRLSVAETVRMGMQAAAGLAAAHAQGLIHRDIKPGNILLEAGTDKVKLTDFGLARAAEDLKLTRTGFVAGTPLYMAPEQARGDDIDQRVDLFSLGTVMYESLAGKPPFEGRSPLAVLKSVADEAHAPLVKLNANVPVWLEVIIDRLLEKDPKDRYSTAQEVSELLALGLAELGSLSPLEVPVTPCSGPRSALKLTHKTRSHVCYKTMGMLASVFVVGAIIGGSGAAAFLPLFDAPRSIAAPVDQMSNLAVSPSLVPVVDEGPESRETLRAQSGAVLSVALTRDGAMLAMGIESGRVVLWNVKKGELKFDLHPDKNDNLPAHAGPVWAVDFSADGSKLVSASDDGTIKVWELSTGKELKAFPTGRSIRSAAVSPSGDWVVVGDRSGSVRVFDLVEQKVVVDYDQGSTVNAVAFAPTSPTMSVASASVDGSVVLWDFTTNRKRFALTAQSGGHSGPVYGLSFSPDATRLATAGWDQKVIVWDLQTGTKQRTIEKAHEDGVWSVEFAPCGRVLATVGQDGKTKIWDGDTGRLLKTLGRHKGNVYTARFNLDGKILATGGRDGSVRIWDIDCKP